MKQIKFATIVVCSLLVVSAVLHATVDPTRPPGQSNVLDQNQQTVKKLKLQGLVVGDDSWIVLNDQVIRKGQTVKGIKLIQVEKNRALVRHNGNRIWLKWQTKVIKKNLKQSQ